MEKFIKDSPAIIPMKDILKLKYINKFKEVERFAAVGTRKESSAEHSWSAMVVADFILTKVKGPIDRLKIYELLMYHDLVEVEVGDTPVIPGKEDAGVMQRELAAAATLREKLPPQIAEKYYALATEFLKQETREAKLARIIDVLDADIHELDYKDDWKGWTEKYYLSKRSHLFEDFPELRDLFDELTSYLKENGFLEKG